MFSVPAGNCLRETRETREFPKGKVGNLFAGTRDFQKGNKGNMKENQEKMKGNRDKNQIPREISSLPFPFRNSLVLRESSKT